jgi:hypothetical protein
MILSLTRKQLRHPITHFFAWLFVGLFATFMMDVWGEVLHVFKSGPGPNYHLLGRYILLAWQSGHFIIPDVAKAAPVLHENLVGWLTHITVGLVDTFIYMTLIFKVLHTKPHLLISLVIGWLLIFMPLLVEQPMLGMGVAGSLTPNPDLTRLITFSYHTVFGLSLFLGSVIFHEIFILMSNLNKKKGS